MGIAFEFEEYILAFLSIDLVFQVRTAGSHVFTLPC